MYVMSLVYAQVKQAPPKQVFRSAMFNHAQPFACDNIARASCTGYDWYALTLE